MKSHVYTSSEEIHREVPLVAVRAKSRQAFRNRMRLGVENMKPALRGNTFLGVLPLFHPSTQLFNVRDVFDDPINGRFLPATAKRSH